MCYVLWEEYNLTHHSRCKVYSHLWFFLWILIVLGLVMIDISFGRFLFFRMMLDIFVFHLLMGLPSRAPATMMRWRRAFPGSATKDIMKVKINSRGFHYFAGFLFGRIWFFACDQVMGIGAKIRGLCLHWHFGTLDLRK